jgi:hypothetical protein
MNEVIYKVSREQVSKMNGKPLTDEEWAVMYDEIVEMLDHYASNEIPALLDELDTYVEEHRQAI